MSRLIRAELLHLLGLKSTYVTTLAVIVLSTLIVGADFSEVGAEGMTSDDDLRGAFASAVTLIPAIGLALFAAVRAAAEFRYGTVAHRALAAPRRGRLVAAKLAAIVPLAMLASGVSIAAGILVASLVSSQTDPALHLSAAFVLEMVAGTTAFACLGTAVGFLSRSQTAAVLVVFGGWVLEKLLEAIVGSAAFLPYSMLGALADDEVLAGCGLGVLTAAALVSATSLLTRKDVV
jgi:hypothetical protein